ncbi:PREDICTED: F-box [Prunus dulcis]|uniref:F-box protein n=1 Tax=Prunus dulcis TaxID=3755 RepID=A0A5E4EAL0_PRUDU|nr:F-box protein At3g12350 [Prunus dulcis]VVA11919.1 PREDICTED: F-box [Prunus dulcis]
MVEESPKFNPTQHFFFPCPKPPQQLPVFPTNFPQKIPKFTWKIKPNTKPKMSTIKDTSLTIDELGCSVSFADFPEDVQLCVLSFLTPPEIASFACTSKRFVSLCKNDGKLWFSMCDRRWGSKTQIKKWGNGKITYRILYQTLSDWENLIGFWRQGGIVTSPPLIFFEWGPSFMTGFRVSPAKDGTYGVVKAPFLWMSLSPEGQVVNFLDPEGRTEISEDFANSKRFKFAESDLVPVNLSLMGKTHFVVEEDMSFGARRSSSSVSGRGEDGGVGEDLIGAETSGSPGTSPDQLVVEIYQYFANRTSPGGDRASRRQRRREKEKQARKKLEPQHFVKIVDCSPTPTRPLQGLWKGIYDDMTLGFYLVAYDDIGGISCQKVCDSSGNFCSFARVIRKHPVFWTMNPTFIESPFSPEEENLYTSRIHLQPTAAADHIHQHLPLTGNKGVSRILCINFSHDLAIPNLAGTTTNPLHAQGRIWQYWDGSFGFGFLQDSFIRDLKRVAKNGCLLDTAEHLL